MTEAIERKARCPQSERDQPTRQQAHADQQIPHEHTQKTVNRHPKYGQGIHESWHR